jgi:GAF domain-containing protein
VTEQLNDVAMSTEFRTLIKQELDIEALLRTTLEYLLSKTGPTNAAVFLPDQDGHFDLGAYVNYDCPRQTIALLLDHLCQAICPQMAEESDIVTFDDAAQFADWIGLDAGTLDDSQVLAFSCPHEGECLAVVVLFRNRSEPFDEAVASTLDILRHTFADQLDHVIRIHNRARPQWPDEAPDEDPELDDYGFGYEGGLAA